MHVVTFSSPTSLTPVAMETQGGFAASLDMVTKTSFKVGAGVFAAVAIVTWRTDVTMERTRRPQSLMFSTKTEHAGKKKALIKITASNNLMEQNVFCYKWCSVSAVAAHKHAGESFKTSRQAVVVPELFMPGDRFKSDTRETRRWSWHLASVLNVEF